MAKYHHISFLNYFLNCRMGYGDWTGVWRHSDCGTRDLPYLSSLQGRDFTIQTLYQGRNCPGHLNTCRFAPKTQQLVATKEADLQTWKWGTPSPDSRIPGCNLRSSLTCPQEYPWRRYRGQWKKIQLKTTPNLKKKEEEKVERKKRISLAWQKRKGGDTCPQPPPVAQPTQGVKTTFLFRLPLESAACCGLSTRSWGLHYPMSQAGCLPPAQLPLWGTVGTTSSLSQALHESRGAKLWQCLKEPLYKYIKEKSSVSTKRP